MQLAEHPFGTIKRAMDQGYFLLRGRKKIRGEFALTALAYNLKRAVKVLGVERLLEELSGGGKSRCVHPSRPETSPFLRICRPQACSPPAGGSPRFPYAPGTLIAPDEHLIWI